MDDANKLEIEEKEPSKQPLPLYMRITEKLHEIFQEDFLRYIISVIVYILAFSAVAWIFGKTLSYTLPFIIAIIIAILLQPLIKITVSKLKWQRDRATALLLFIVILVIIAVLSWIVFQVVLDIIQLINSIRNANFAELLTNFENRFGKIPVNFEDMTLTSLIQKYKPQILSALNKNKSLATTTLSAVMSTLGQVPLYLMFILSIVFGAYYFSRDWGTIRNTPNIILKPTVLQKTKSVENEGFKIASRYLALYVRASLVSMIVSMLIFVIFGVKYSFLLAALVGFCELMPVVGPVFVYLPLAVHYVFQRNWIMALVMLGSIILLAIIRQFTKSKSKVLSRSMEIHPLTMTAITFWSLQAKNASLLIFLTLMIVGYKILLQTKIIVSPFAKDDDHITPKRKKRWFRLFQMDSKKSDQDKHEEEKPHETMANHIEKTFLDGNLEADSASKDVNEEDR